jgi:hypothetical protein
MDIQRINHMLVKAIGGLQEGELGAVVEPLAEESLPGRASASDVLIDPGSKKVALALFNTQEKFIEFSSPEQYKVKMPLVTVAKFYLGWVPHRQGTSLKKLGINPAVLKDAIPPSAIPKPKPKPKVFVVPKKGQTALLDGKNWKVVSVGKQKAIGMDWDAKPFHDVTLKSGSEAEKFRYFLDDGRLVNHDYKGKSYYKVEFG